MKCDWCGCDFDYDDPTVPDLQMCGYCGLEKLCGDCLPCEKHDCEEMTDEY